MSQYDAPPRTRDSYANKGDITGLENLLGQKIEASRSEVFEQVMGLAKAIGKNDTRLINAVSWAIFLAALNLLILALVVVKVW